MRLLQALDGAGDDVQLARAAGVGAVRGADLAGAVLVQDVGVLEVLHGRGGHRIQHMGQCGQLEAFRHG